MYVWVCGSFSAWLVWGVGSYMYLVSIRFHATTQKKLPNPPNSPDTHTARPTAARAGHGGRYWGRHTAVLDSRPTPESPAQNWGQRGWQRGEGGASRGRCPFRWGGGWGRRRPIGGCRHRRRRRRRRRGGGGRRRGGGFRGRSPPVCFWVCFVEIGG